MINDRVRFIIVCSSLQNPIKNESIVRTKMKGNNSSIRKERERERDLFIKITDGNRLWKIMERRERGAFRCIEKRRLEVKKVWLDGRG